MEVFKLMLLAGCGGFIGTSARFLINRLFIGIWNMAFPLATFVINITGCLAFGLMMGVMQKTNTVSPTLNALLIVGFCGGYTTFSTFSYETLNMGLNGQAIISLLYIVSSVVLGIVACWFGFKITS